MVTVERQRWAQPFGTLGRRVLAALLCLAGLSGVAPAGAAQGVVRVWMTEYTPETRKLFDEGPESLKARFEQEHPGLRLEFAWLPWDTVESELAYAIASGSPPDVVQLSPESLPGLASYLSPLDAARWGRSDFYAPALERATWNGELYGLPVLLDAKTVLYDQAPLIEAGYNVRALPRRWDEYKEFVVALTRTGANPVIGTAPGRLIDHRTWLVLFWQAGGELFDGTNRLAIENGEGAKALRFLKELHAAVAGAEPLVGGGPALLWGSVASLFGGVEDLHLVAAYNPVKLDFVEVGEPLADVRQAAWVQADVLSVPAAARNRTGALAVLDFLARPEHLAAYAESVGYLPARREAFGLASRLNESPHYRRLVEVVEKYGKAAPLAPRGPLLDALISEAILNTLEKGWEPETALAHVRQRYTSWVQAGVVSNGR